GLIVLAMGLSALIFHRFRWQLKMKKLEEIDAFRKAAAEDFHDELGSKLTIISLFSEITRDKLNEAGEEVQPYLGKVIDTSNSLYHSMKDLIWALNPEQDKIIDLAIQIKDFGDEIFHETGIEFNAEGLDQAIVNQEIPMAFKRHILLVFKEAMNNILKHSECDQATLSLYNGNQSLKIKLTDNGKGFSQELKETGDGLKNMSSRAQRIKGTLSIDSQLGKGTSILLECPLPN
ncbi:MAG: ATP-binding protein, partial [Bacteroidota bacterium]